MSYSHQRAFAGRNLNLSRKIGRRHRIGKLIGLPASKTELRKIADDAATKVLIRVLKPAPNGNPKQQLGGRSFWKQKHRGA